MDKVWAILEKYVEWIAIAIGGLIFMYAVWIYWINPDVTAQVNGQDVGPRTVNQAVLRGSGESLESAIQRTTSDPGVTPEDILTQVLNLYHIKGYDAGQLRVPGLFAGVSPLGRPEEFVPTDFKVDAAPTPPAATVTRLASGRSFADVPGAQNQVSTRDLAEVRVDFAIEPLAIAHAFRKVLLPTVRWDTSLLRVTLQRQRLLADGSWGEDYDVPLLSNNPLASMPIPPANASIETKTSYAAFAERNSTWLTQPKFYDVRAGDDPMALDKVVIPDEGGADQAAGQVKPEGNGQSRTNYNFQDDPRTKQGDAAQAAPQPQTPQPQNRPGQDVVVQPPSSQGVFNPSRLQQPIRGWAWDGEAVPGETYRYRAIYILKNPMFNTRGIAKRPELEALLPLPCDVQATAWSPQITVEPLTYFFMTGSTTSQAKFTVFRWQNGGWQSQDFEVAAGDYIGAQRDDGIDYRTGRTLVDVREDPATKETYALLVDDEGRFLRRSAKDANDPKLKELQQEIKANADGGVASR